MNKRIITAESVTQGHPDKLADLIADSILDRCLLQDKNARVACEVLLSGKRVVLAGEITTIATYDPKLIAEEVIAKVGYNTSELVFINLIAQQSQDISQAVTKENGEVGAGDQGAVVGYACDETVDFMPLPITLAHRLTDRLTFVRENNIIKGLLPDGKSQVSVAYNGERVECIHSVVLSAQHEEEKDIDTLRAELKQHVIDFVFADIDLEIKHIDINPSGRFVLGGFEADTGLTGRKLMVDSYGTSAHHGGGAFSGKDPTKVDRSGAYFARYIAKNIVACGLAEKCEVALSYAIGKQEPTSIDIDTFYTGAVSEQLITQAVEKVFDFSITNMLETLNLKSPQYAKTASSGHFGNESYSWEKLDKVEELKKVVLEG